MGRGTFKCTRVWADEEDGGGGGDMRAPTRFTNARRTTAGMELAMQRTVGVLSAS